MGVGTWKEVTAMLEKGPRSLTNNQDGAGRLLRPRDLSLS
jgi:hypothetical protein